MQPEEIASWARSGKKKRLWRPDTTTVAVDHGRKAVEQLLPHRDPFLFVDRITAIDLDQGAIAGMRRIDPKDPLFVGHFPGHPIYPGVLQLETMGQLGICLASFAARKSTAVGPDVQPTDVRALKIHYAIFVSELGPGDEVEILATLIESDEYGAICAGQLLKSGAVVAFALMEVHLPHAAA